MATRSANLSDRSWPHDKGSKAEVVPVKIAASSKKERDRAHQDPALSDYRLGDCIGKGAFASVYKAFSWGTGDTVAVKQIRLVDLSKSELHAIETEIDLLKGLHHEHIVKYLGFVKSADCLNIILEYCENGSLHSICKAYGKFPENLVGVYMTQVLDGLRYLHHQGVIHRDIKGANILTTKNGMVKLADFGVSISTIGNPVKEAQVVGTPYWMAPEIIQLSAPTSASDIWSVGCTVIELLEGKPPYHNLAPMPALFAIVNDDHPPVPDGVSPAARDFLMQCFQKDPNLRVTASKLIKHTWIVGCSRKEVFASKENAVKGIKEYNQRLESSKNTIRGSSGSAYPHNTLHVNGRMGQVNLFPKQSQQSPLRLDISSSEARNRQTPLKIPTSQSHESFMMPEKENEDNWDDDFATAISPTALRLPYLRGQSNDTGDASQARPRPSVIPNTQVGSDQRDSRQWGDQSDTSRPGSRIEEYFLDSEPDDSTIRLTPRLTNREVESRARSNYERSPTRRKPAARGAAVISTQVKPALSRKFELPARPMSLYREQSVDDYSDLFDLDDDDVFETAVSQAPRMAESRVTSKQPVPVAKNAVPSVRVRVPSADTALGQARPSSSSRSSVSGESFTPPVRRIKSQIEIQKYAESEDDEDFSDVFGPNNSKLSNGALKGRDTENGAELMLMSKFSNNSWLGDDDDEDDPFAMMDPAYEMDVEANIARDRHARLAQRVEELVRLLKAGDEGPGEQIIADGAEDLLELLYENKEAKDLVVSAHGLLPILELLTWPHDTLTIPKSQQDMILPLLKVINKIILDDKELQENLCFVGGIPIITRFAARQFSNDLRMEAAAFVQQMYQTSTLTLQIFVSCGGIPVLAGYLDEDYETARDLVIMGVNGIWSVYGLQGPTPKNDFCRLFSKAKILDPLAEILHRVLDEDERDELSEFVEGRIVDLFHLFSQADADVKELIADRAVLKTVLKDLKRMTPVHQITMLKFIKNISSLPATVEVLHSADAIDCLIELLSQSMRDGSPHIREISNQVLNTMFNLCRLSKERQEYAAVQGIVPLLLKILKTERPPKEFALPVLCDMAHSGSRGRRYLWQNKGLDFYVSLLTDQYWQTTAMDAIFVWLQEETAKVETHLLAGDFESAIVSCFTNPKINAFAYDPTLLEPLHKVLRLSPALAASLAKPEMYAGVESKLSHKKPVIRLGLLRLVRDIMEGCDPDTGIHDQEAGGAALKRMFDSIQKMEKDTAVLVGNLARELVKTHAESIDTCDNLSIASGVSSGGGSGRSRPNPRRRKSLYMTPPSLQPSGSAPPLTPLGGHHDRPQLRHTDSAGSSSGLGSVYQQIAHTPGGRAQKIAAAHDQDSVNLRRPRSKDGGPATLIPRRVSGEISSVNGFALLTRDSRLPRTSTSTSTTSSRPITASSIPPATPFASLTPTKSSAFSSTAGNVVANGRAAHGNYAADAAGNTAGLPSHHTATRSESSISASDLGLNNNGNQANGIRDRSSRYVARPSMATSSSLLRSLAASSHDTDPRKGISQSSRRSIIMSADAPTSSSLAREKSVRLERRGTRGPGMGTETRRA